jgi:hypothetical protein
MVDCGGDCASCPTLSVLLTFITNASFRPPALESPSSFLSKINPPLFAPKTGSGQERLQVPELERRPRLWSRARPDGLRSKSLTPSHASHHRAAVEWHLDGGDAIDSNNDTSSPSAAI